VIKAQGTRNLARVGSNAGLTQRPAPQCGDVDAHASERECLWLTMVDVSPLAALVARPSGRLLEYSEVPEKPPQDDENQDSAETATAQLLRAVASRDPA
jgi:hypothetical protein